MTSSSCSTTVIVLLCLCCVLPAGTLGASAPESYCSQAQALLGHGEFDKALAVLSSGLSLYPDSASLRHDLAAGYLQLAKNDLKLSHYQEAADTLARARDLYPGDQRFNLLRGIALYQAKNYPAARAELQQVTKGTEALFYLGKLSYDTGDLPAALDSWRRVLELNPKIDAVRVMIAKAQRELDVESTMDKGYDGRFVLSFDAALPAGLSTEVLEALEAAYASIGADLGLFPEARVPVLLYSRSAYSSATSAADWSDGLYDGKIRLPLGGVSKLTQQMRRTLFHEYTHVLVAELTHGNVPTWLNEGLAQIEELKEFKLVQKPIRLARGEQPIPLATLSGSFLSMDRAQARRAYQQSYSMVNFMVTRYGWYAMRSILRGLGEGLSQEAAVAQGLSEQSLDLAGVLAEWRKSLPGANGTQ